MKLVHRKDLHKTNLGRADSPSCPSGEKRGQYGKHSKGRVLFFSLLLLILTLLASACGTDKETADYNGHSYEELEGNAIGLWENLKTVSPEEMEKQVSYVEAMTLSEKEEYLSQSQERALYYEFLKAWHEISGQVGDFNSIGDFSVLKAGKTTTGQLHLNFSEREVILSEVYSSASMKLEDANIEIVYRLSEKMQKAAITMVMGMSIVFGMLILISLIISCFRFIPKLEAAITKLAAGKAERLRIKTEQKAVKDQHGDSAGSQNAKDRYGDSAGSGSAKEQIAFANGNTEEITPELVAVIAAAVAAVSDMRTEGFVVRSIRRRK
ncbi:hypothetical protein FACS1894111_13380 [Clostridia bacterium]|nr:hypothetical protein FACS1894111_13380 [Clostridia bacterium]